MAVLFKLIPTLIFLFFFLFSVLAGLLRGFRKSLILFIQYLISMAIGMIIFFVARQRIFTQDLSFIFSKVGTVAGANLSSASTVFDAVEIFIAAKAPSYVGLVNIAEMQTLISIIASLAINIALFTACLIVIPLLIDIILRIIYAIFYSEHKYKMNKELDNEEYKKHRFGGLLVGIVRGFIFGTIVVSLFTSIIFIGVGGASSTEENNGEAVALIEDLGVSIKFPGNLSVVGAYQSLVESRKSGIGVLFDLLKFDFFGTGEAIPIDYFMFDLALSSYKYESVYVDSDGKAIQSQIILRKELANVVNLLNQLVKLDVVKIENKKISINFQKLEESNIEEVLTNFIDSSKLLSDIVPLAIVGLSKGINKGYITGLPASVSELFDDNAIEALSSINYKNDMKSIVKVAVKALSLLEFDSEGNIDLTMFKGGELGQMADFVLSRDIDTVKEIFNSLSEIELITKAIAPIGYALGTSKAGDKLSSDTDKLDIAVKDINWAYEISNFGFVYEQLYNVNASHPISNVFTFMDDLDKYREKFSNLGNMLEESEVETAAYKYTKAAKDLEDEIKEMANDEATKSSFRKIIDLLIAEDYSFDEAGAYSGGSRLIGHTVKDILLYIIKTKDLSNVIGGSWEEVQNNFFDEDGNNNYKLYKNGKLYEEFSVSLLNEDIHTILTSIGDGIPFLSSLLTADIPNAMEDILQILPDLDIDAARLATIGSLDYETGEYVGGIYDLNLVSHKLEDKNKNASLFGLVLKGFLVQGASSLIAEEKLDEIEKDEWKNEIAMVFETIDVIRNIEGMTELKISADKLISSFPAISDSDVDKLSATFAQSKIITAIIDDQVVGALDNVEALSLGTDELGNKISWTNYEDKDGNKIKWEDTFLKDENGDYVIVNGKRVVETKGEINHILKAVVVLVKKDPNTGKSRFIGDDNEINLGLETLNLLERNEVDTFTDSQVILHVVDKTVTDLLAEQDLKVVNVNWPNIYSDPEERTEENLMIEGELWVLVQILGIDAFKNEDGSINIENLTDIDTIASLSHSERVLTAKSQIIMSNIGSKLAEMTTEELTIVVPQYLLDSDETTTNWLGWSYQELVDGKPDYTTGEFYKLITVLSEAKDALQPTSNPSSVKAKKANANEVALTTDNLFEGLVKMNHEDLVQSDTLYATISNAITTNEDMKIRDKGLTNDSAITNDEILYRDEIVLLLDVLKELEIYSTSNIDVDAESLLNKINDKRLRRLVCQSNILNITIVDKITGAASGENGLSLPENYDENKWYYAGTDKNTWENTELNRMLMAIYELTEGEDSPIKVNKNDIEVDNEATAILEILNEGSKTESGKTKVDTVYSSDIVAYMITEKVNEQTEAENPDLLVREAYVYDEERGLAKEYLKKDEVILLVNFISKNKDDFDMDDPSMASLLTLIDDEENRKDIVRSNILNITIVNKIKTTDGLELPEKYKDVNFAEWYYGEDNSKTDDENFASSELYRILLAINEMHIGGEHDPIITVSGSDVNMSEDNTLILSALGDQSVNGEPGDSKIKVAYRSDVVAFTITSKIKEVDDILIREDYAYDNSRGASKEYFYEDEIESLIKIISSNPDFDMNNPSIGSFLDLLNDEDSRRRIVQSNILNITIVQKISDQNDIELPSSYKPGEGETLDSKEAWFYQGQDKSTYKQSELYKLLVAINEMNTGDNPSITVDPTDDNKILMSDNNTEILSSLNGQANNGIEGVKKIDLVYKSDVIAYTITTKVSEAEGVMIREEYAYHQREVNYTSELAPEYQTENYLLDDEVTLLIDLIANNPDFDMNEPTLKAFLELLGNETYRQEICQSNILNITIVQKISDQNDMELPSSYSDNTDAGWYYEGNDKSTYKQSELYKLLVAINEMNTGENPAITVDPDDDNKINMGSDNDKILRSLDAQSDTNSTLGVKKINVVYDSDVMAFTITTKVSEQDSIYVRDQAYNKRKVNYQETSQPEDYIIDSEIVDLITFITSHEGLDFGSMTSETFFELLKDDGNRKAISISNILNITVVAKLIENGGDSLSIPVKLSDTNPEASLKDKASQSGWYYQEDSNNTPEQNKEAYYEASEIYRLFVAIDQMQSSYIDSDNVEHYGMEADGNEIKIGDATTLLNVLNANVGDEKRLSIVYRSDVLALTISKQVQDQKEQGNLQIRDQAVDTVTYRKEEIASGDKYIRELELTWLMGYISDNGFDIENIDGNLFLRSISPKMMNPDGEYYVPDDLEVYTKDEFDNYIPVLGTNRILYHVDSEDNPIKYYDKDHNEIRPEDVATDNPYYETNVNRVALSNILNITFVDLVAKGGTAMEVPGRFYNGGSEVDINFNDWYYPKGKSADDYKNGFTDENGTITNNDFKDGEVYKMVKAISVLKLGSIDEQKLADDLDRIIGRLNGEGAVGTVYESEVIKLTVSYQVLNEESLFVPLYYQFDKLELSLTNIVYVEDAMFPDELYITQVEMENLVAAIDKLKISFKTVSQVSFKEFLNNLSDPDDVKTVVKSAIVDATMSNVIYEQGTNLTIPSWTQFTSLGKNSPQVGNLEEGYGIYRATGNLKVLELFLYANDIEGLINASRYSEINLDNSEEINVNTLDSAKLATCTAESEIFRATVSVKITTSEGITVPYYNESGVSIFDAEDPTISGIETYLLATEISNTFDAINAIGVTDFAAINDGIEISNISTETLGQIVTNSNIFRATISYKITSSTDGIKVPAVNEDGVTIYGSDGLYLKAAEIIATYAGIKQLDISDFTTMNSSVEITNITNIDEILASNIFRATISYKITTSTDGIKVPEVNEEGVTIYGADGLYLTALEIKNTYLGIKQLNISDFTAMNSSVEVSNITDIDEILASNIFRATISDKISQTSGLTIPKKDSAGDSIYGADETYLKKNELKYMFNSINILGATDFSSINGSFTQNLTLTQVLNNWDSTLSKSAIVHSLLSKNLIEQNVVVRVYFGGEVTDTNVVIKTGTTDHMTNYVLSDEIKYALQCAASVGIIRVEQVSPENFDTSHIKNTNVEIMKSSSIMNVIFSSLILSEPMLAAMYSADTVAAVNPNGDVNINIIYRYKMNSILDNYALLNS